MSRPVANLLLLLTGAIWGMGFVAQSTAMDAIGPVFFTGVRFLAAAVALAPLALWETRRIARQSGEEAQPPIGRYILLGTLLFSSLVTQQIGLLTTTVTNSGFLTGIYVVLVPIFAVLFFRQWPHPIVWPAVLAIILGIFLLAGGKLDGMTEGDIWTLGCAALWAMHVLVLGRTISNSNRPFTLAFTQFLTCAVLGMGLGLAIETVSMSMILAAAPEILFAGVVSGGVAFTLQAIAQRFTTAPQAAIFMSSEALFAALFGALILSERIPAIGLWGCALIFAAMLAVELVPMIGKRAQIEQIRPTNQPHNS